MFTADRLRRFPDNPLPGQASENPLGKPVEPNGELEYKVNKIIASRTDGGKLQYQAQWKGWDPDPEWYPVSDFKNSHKLLRQFHYENPERAGPPRRLEEWLRAAENDKFAEDHVEDKMPVK